MLCQINYYHTIPCHTIPIPTPPPPPPPPPFTIPMILSYHLYGKHKTIVGNMTIQFVILPIDINLFCLTTITTPVHWNIATLPCTQ